MGKKCDACSLKVRQGPKCLVSRSCRALGRGAGQGGAWAAALRLLLCPNWLPSSLPPCLSCCPVEEEASNVCPFQARLPSALFLLNELSTPASPCRAQLLWKGRSKIKQVVTALIGKTIRHQIAPLLTLASHRGWVIWEKEPSVDTRRYWKLTARCFPSHMAWLL